MKKGIDELLEILITLTDLIGNILKGIKKLKRHFKKKKLTTSKTI